MEKIDCKGLYIYKDKKFVPYELTNSKTIMCGIPGAFTDGCTKKHLPGFANALDYLKEKGIDKVVFVGVNDPIVMDVWNKQHGHKDIDSVSDPLAVFTKRIKKDEDWGDCFGVRCSRYAYLIEEGKIVKEFKNPFIEGVLQEI